MTAARPLRAVKYTAPVLPDALAHAGGWDEILLVVVPLAILWGVLMLANKRARRLADEEAAREANTDTDTA